MEPLQVSSTCNRCGGTDRKRGSRRSEECHECGQIRSSLSYHWGEGSGGEGRGGKGRGKSSLPIFPTLRNKDSKMKREGKRSFIRW